MIDYNGNQKSLSVKCQLTVPNSLVVMVPSPSLSNRENASLNSAICSSVSWSAWREKMVKIIFFKDYWWVQKYFDVLICSYFWRCLYVGWKNVDTRRLNRYINDKKKKSHDETETDSNGFCKHFCKSFHQVYFKPWNPKYCGWHHFVKYNTQLSLIISRPFGSTRHLTQGCH